MRSFIYDGVISRVCVHTHVKIYTSLLSVVRNALVFTILKYRSDLIKVEAAFQKRFDAHKVFGHWTKNRGSVSDGEIRARLKLKCKLSF